MTRADDPSEGESDHALLEAWAAGDREAAGKLLARHFDRLYRFFETSAPGQAEDLLQDTLLGCIESHTRYRREASFVAFLMGIARNKVLMYWRTKGRRPAMVDVAELSLVALGASPSTMLADRRELQLLFAAMRQIPIDAQMLLQLHYWDGLNGPSLAAALEVPEGTVRSRLRRAKTQLREAMESADFPHRDEGALDEWMAALGEPEPSSR
jgi:RNA polymerase sigma-70 factor (ECF subfamily)